MKRRSLPSGVEITQIPLDPFHQDWKKDLPPAYPPAWKNMNGDVAYANFQVAQAVRWALTAAPAQWELVLSSANAVIDRYKLWSDPPQDIAEKVRNGLKELLLTLGAIHEQKNEHPLPDSWVNPPENKRKHIAKVHVPSLPVLDFATDDDDQGTSGDLLAVDELSQSQLEELLPDGVLDYFFAESQKGILVDIAKKVRQQRQVSGRKYTGSLTSVVWQHLQPIIKGRRPIAHKDFLTICTALEQRADQIASTRKGPVHRVSKVNLMS